MSSYVHEVNFRSIRPFAGSPRKVCRQLDCVHDGHVVAVVLNRSNVREAKVIEQVFLQAIQLTQPSLAEQSVETLATLVAALLPREMLSSTLLKETQMQLRAKEAVLTSGDWLNAVDLATILGPSSKNPNSKLRKWTRDGTIFSIRHNGVEYFPGYALDPLSEYRPYRALKTVISQFAGTGDGWGLALWFHAANSLLGGRCPRELIATQSDRVVAASADEVIGVAHA